MQMNDMILVSIDDHVVEPPDAFLRHMPSKFKDRAPRVETRGGKDFWNIDGKLTPLSGLNAVVGRPKDEWGVEPEAFSQLRPGCYDLKARLDDMNVNGVLASMCFPNLLGFGGGLTLSTHDREYGKALVQCYNDWHIGDWVGEAAGRHIPLAVLPLWDIEASVQEVKRLAALGVHAVVFPENPAYEKRLPTIHSDYWDPLWRALSDHAMVICCHIGTAGPAPITSLEEPVCAWATTLPLATNTAVADWIFAPMWKKFPRLRVAMAEAGVGWVPFLLERADYSYHQHREWTHTDLGNDLPSDIFKRHFILCFLSDKFGVENSRAVGIDNIAWESDYPHSDCTWPNSPEIAWESVKSLSDEDINKVTHLNVMRDFSFDPFKAIPRDKATVGALRYAARNIDITPVSLPGIKPGSDGSVVNMGHLLEIVSRQQAGASQ